MNAIWQVLLALLAVVGLLALGWLLFGKLVTPEKEVEKWMKHYKKKEISVETAGIFLFMF